ncbi:hypothetical protein DFH28DRAFT_1223720 [Melampsora americana]|nr:hypothetical protein DFH28DRAFT_1223720 [Melampsora americana]
MSLNLNHLGRYISALSIGKLPTQSQLDLILKALLDSPIFIDPSSEIIDSLKTFIEAFRRFTDSKNAHNQFQRLLHAASNLVLEPIIESPSTSQGLPTPQELSQSILDFLNILFTSNQFRSLINDTIDLFIQIILPNQTSSKNPQELIDNISNSLVSILIRIDNNLKSKLFKTISTLFSWISDYIDHFDEEIHQNVEINEIFETGFDLICQFTKEENWNEFGEVLSEILKILKNDQGLKKIGDEFQNLISESINNSQLIYTSTFYKRLESILIKLWKEIQPKPNPNYQKPIQKPIEKITQIIKRMKDEIINDQISINLIQSLGELVQHFQFDELEKSVSGVKRKVSRSKIWYELWVYLVPKLLAMIQEIPLPRIEFVSREFEFAIDPLTLRSMSGFMPDQIRFTNKNVVDFKHTAPRTITESSTRTSSITSTQTLILKGLRLFTKDVGFYFKKKIDPEKSWLSRMTTSEFEDEGLLDVFVGMGTEDGISCVMEIEIGGNEENEDERLLKVKATHFDVQGLSLYPHDSTHPVLNWFLKPGLALYLQSKLSETVESYISHQLQLLEELVHEIQSRWDRSRVSKPSTSSEETEEGGGGSKKKLYGTNLKIEAEDKSYVISIGIGDNLLKGKGIGGRRGGDLKRVKEIAGGVVEEARMAVQQKLERVDEFVEAVEQGRERGESEDDWKSDAFNL